MNNNYLYSLELSLDNRYFKYFNTTTNIRSKKYLHKTEWEKNKWFSKKGILLEKTKNENVDKMSINEEKKAEKGRSKNVQTEVFRICENNFFVKNNELFKNVKWEDWLLSEIKSLKTHNARICRETMLKYVNGLTDNIDIEDNNRDSEYTRDRLYCDICDYSCDYESKMNRHNETKKHIANIKLCEPTKEDLNLSQNTIVKAEESGNRNIELVNTLIKQNQEFKEMIVELTKTNNAIHNTMNGNINNNNNKFNINIFLNESCNQAINFKDFIDKIEVSQDDLENNAQLGFVEGISKIILDNLRQMSIHERPIHCTDLKRETMYIKDEDKWLKDENSVKIKRGIQKVSIKSITTLNEWKETNPDYKDVESEFSTKCITMMQQSNAGFKRETYYPKVVKTLAKETVLNKRNIIETLGKDKTIGS